MTAPRWLLFAVAAAALLGVAVAGWLFALVASG